MSEIEMALHMYYLALEKARGPVAQPYSEAVELAERGELEEITRRTALLMGQTPAQVSAARRKILGQGAPGKKWWQFWK